MLHYPVEKTPSNNGVIMGVVFGVLLCILDFMCSQIYAIDQEQLHLWQKLISKQSHSQPLPPRFSFVENLQDLQHVFDQVPLEIQFKKIRIFNNTIHIYGWVVNEKIFTTFYNVLLAQKKFSELRLLQWEKNPNQQSKFLWQFSMRFSWVYA